jgi:hypothetical protein
VKPRIFKLRTVRDFAWCLSYRYEHFPVRFRTFEDAVDACMYALYKRAQ